MRLQIRSSFTVFSRFDPSDYYQFTKDKKMLPGKSYGEDLIAVIEAYFEGLKKSFHNKSTEMLKQYWNDGITLEGDFVDE